MKLIRSAAVAALLAGPFTVSARPRVVVVPLTAERGGALSRQLAAVLCERLECVPRSTAYSGRRADFAKARRNGVSGIVYGAVTGKAPNRMLWLALLTGSPKPDRTWSLALNARGLLARTAAEAVARDVERRLGPPGSTHPPAPGPAAAPAPPRPSPPPPRAAPPADAGRAVAAVPPPPVRAPVVPPPETAERAGSPPRGTIATVPEEPRDAEGPEAPSPLRGAVELGAWVTGRELTYAGTEPPGSRTLQTMKVDAVACPRAYLEVFPAAALGPGPLAGLGAFADYRRSVGFEVAAGSETHSARISRLSAGLTFRLPPLSGLRLAPAVSYERLEVIVSAAVPGLPDARLQGVRVGARLEVPVGARFALLVGGGWVRWTSAPDLVEGDVAFFPSGSASALEAEAGLSLAFTRRLSVRMLGEYSSTRYALDADATGTYRASEATDRYLGGRAAMRAEF